VVQKVLQSCWVHGCHCNDCQAETGLLSHKATPSSLFRKHCTKCKFQKVLNLFK
jgi:hypothetical protein